ncbi:MAG: hypothetical protein COZ80_07505 [Ignavibacteria bacterium CG_4_8_14_3_um_filter_37_9]|nr:hypothetical protein [Ignavibacteria bacterium]OIO19633.1 MAG: hypothetical protein AUJ54_06360 [Ignavibacteria bacterium CG1_02_37_35]PIP79373.1 MAG: hypothetical protein COW85_01320 [Ignavibacteria bacterium CG22_combo_CG10-13_8_21_14_all_37_15]PIS44976.1 MAG: hypothetical protein COT22_07700 [Ignavibacteria bacterium CG08_land_8_20_14_0_20_37_9]PIW99041.1 MAG: hypothetical protein COZ80_07505 [Ignavibacteria bacterium CG_4_8_14_3_um_filter_37_9]PIX93784.1 MAG: hypothetical protein COZ25_
MEKIIENTPGEDNFLLGFGLSFGFHFLLVCLAIALRIGVFSSSNSVQKSFAPKLQFMLESNAAVLPNLNSETMSTDKPIEKSSISESSQTSAALLSPFANADTSTLTQDYSETSLNVKLKFPGGWKYIDQNVKKKLDGVTFFADPQIFNPPPYVHLDVAEKYLFNPAHFSQKMKTSRSEYYFNDPEELEGTYSLIIYIKTDTKEDFIIKLIVKGKEPFYRFLPSFWGIVQSFEFGNSIF